MLTPDSLAPGGERVKVLDFGIAKLSLGEAGGTDGNVIMGTPSYMSPEQCRGARQVDPRTDVYSLGVILYELLSGRPPFVGDPGELVAKHLFHDPAPLASVAPDVPVAVCSLVLRLLVKDREERPRMAEVGERAAADPGEPARRQRQRCSLL